MITPDDALARLLALAEPVNRETLPLDKAAGRWAAVAISALRTQPAHDLSAMDGYAIRYADMPGPWRVIGESAAGSPSAGSIGRGEAMRIFTGAMLPGGADSIIIQEDVTREGEMLILTGDGPAQQGAHVRRAGSDFIRGQRLIEPGDALTPARIGLAAIGGHAALPARRRIRIALVSTGDELIPVGAEPVTGMLPASNAVMLAAMLGTLPVDLTDVGIVPDNRAALAAMFRRVVDHDIVVTTGGASVGDHDLVRPALIDAGAAIDFWKIAMRPGKPLMAGRLGNAVALGLPGNPVSAFVTATLFLTPLIAHMSGAKAPAPALLAATLADDLPATGVRTDYVRARWRDGAIAPLTGDSGMLFPLADATSLIVRPANSGPARTGDEVMIIILA